MTGRPADGDLDALRQAFAAHDADVDGGSSCPSAETIWDSVAGTLPPSRTRSVVLHTSSCGGCAQAWRIAGELGAGRSAEVHPRRLRIVLPLAAAATIAAALLLPLAWRTDRPAAIYREARPSSLASRTEDGAVLPRDDFRLRWADAGPGATYTARVSTEDLKPVARAHDLTTPEFVVLQAALASFPAGATLLWQAEARLPDGTTLATSTQVARLR